MSKAISSDYVFNFRLILHILPSDGKHGLSHHFLEWKTIDNLALLSGGKIRFNPTRANKGQSKIYVYI